MDMCKGSYLRRRIHGQRYCTDLEKFNYFRKERGASVSFVVVTVRSKLGQPQPGAFLDEALDEGQQRELQSVFANFGREQGVPIHQWSSQPGQLTFLFEEPTPELIQLCKDATIERGLEWLPQQCTSMIAAPVKEQSRRLLEAGKAFCNLGLPEDAETQLRLAVEQDPGCAEAYHYLAAVLKRRNQSKKALQLTRKGLEANRDDAGFRYLLGDLFADCDQLDQAINHLKEAIRLQPDSASPYARLGQVFKRSGQSDAAQLAFEEALQRDITHQDALLGLGSLYLEQGKLDLALPMLAQVVSQDPASSEGRLKLGWALLHSGKSHQAEVEFLRVANAEESPFKSSARFSLGRLYASQNHHGLAIELLRQVVADQPEFGEARLLLGQALSEVGNYRDALINLHECLGLLPARSSEIKPQIALCLSRLGEHDLAIPLAQECLLEQGADFHLLELLASLYMAAEEWDEARITLLELQKKDHESAFLAYQIGWVYENLNDPQTAESYYVKALKLDPNLSEAYVGLGWLHYEREQKEVALVLFEKACELDPLQGDLIDQVGWVHLLLNHLPEALRCFNEAIHIDGANPLYLCHRGAALFRQEQYAAAEDEIERALLMNPDPFVEAFCHFIIGMSLEAQGRENSYERQMESSIELVPPEFVAMTSHSGARDKSAWKKFGKEKKERKARLKGA